MRDTIEQFRHAVRERNILAPDDLRAEGKPHRVARYVLMARGAT